MKWSVIGLMGLGLAAALSAALMVSSMQKSKADAVASVLPPEAEVSVLIAASDVPPHTVIRAEHVEKKTVKASDAPMHRVGDPAQVVGRVLMINMLEGQAFTKDCFAPKGSGVHLASTLKPGMRAVTISLPSYAGMDGLLYPGCVVDVLASFQLQGGRREEGQAISTTLLQAVPVVAIESETIATQYENEEEEKDARSSATNSRGQGRGINTYKRKVTLMVNPRQAEALQLALTHGEVSLSMRNPLDGADIDKDATLLNGGRLAKLAEFMSTTVSKDDDGGDRASDNRIDESGETPLSAPAPTPDWQTEIFRGTNVEVRSFNRNAVPRAPENTPTPDKSQDPAAPAGPADKS